MEFVCRAYAEAIEQYETRGLHTVCIDEQTGIQALERIAPDIPMQPGRPARLEFEYKRHGTIGLFGNLHVPTGRILEPMLRETRTEDDFLENLDQVVCTDVDAPWRIICDNLNTHLSESLVRYVAHSCDIEEDLGAKGRRGILKSVATRRAFLSDTSHRIHFVYLPKHTSWLNQIEIWFGILRRKAIRRGFFRSLTQLKDRILDFIDYYNATMARPFQWTYHGKVLCR